MRRAPRLAPLLKLIKPEAPGFHQMRFDAVAKELNVTRLLMRPYRQEMIDFMRDADA